MTRDARIREQTRPANMVIMLMCQQDSSHRRIRQLRDLLLQLLRTERIRRVGNQHAFLANHYQTATKQTEEVIHVVSQLRHRRRRELPILRSMIMVMTITRAMLRLLNMHDLVVNCALPRRRLIRR